MQKNKDAPQPFLQNNQQTSRHWKKLTDSNTQKSATDLIPSWPPVSQWPRGQCTRLRHKRTKVQISPQTQSHIQPQSQQTPASPTQSRLIIHHIGCIYREYSCDMQSWARITHLYSALHPSGVAKSITSFSCGKGRNVTSDGWQVTLWSHVVCEFSQRCKCKEAMLHCRLLHLYN